MTVCQIHDINAQWDALCAHVQKHDSDLVLLPEMIFAPWFAATNTFDAATWDAAVAAHEAWLPRLGELGAPVVASTRPQTNRDKRFNSAFVWTRTGHSSVHNKAYLPDDPGYWEASWYHRGDTLFPVANVDDVLLGFAICTEIWFMEVARAYAERGVHLLLNPRATGYDTRQKWLVGGRAAAVVSGAFGLSSNRRETTPEDTFGGFGWVVDPDGEVIATTSDAVPYVTVEIDLAVADAAKSTYPRYVER